ncbi:MAG: Sua5 family C-terminal domain-containing protein, partial [Rubrivivax sp.]
PLSEPDAASPRASGTLESHYAPTAKVVLVDAAALPAMLQTQAGNQGLQGVAVYSRVSPPASAGVEHRRMPGSADAVAHELFAMLRAFDAAGASQIWVERPPPGSEWDGVRDRLQRAAAA